MKSRCFMTLAVVHDYAITLTLDPPGMHLARAVADPDAATRGARGGPRLVTFTSAQVPVVRSRVGI